MAKQAIGILETRGLTALVQGTDAMLKAANVELTGPMKGIGAALVSATITGDVAAVKAAIDAGVTAVIQPGGSIRDDEVVAAANEAGIAMVLTGHRHFRH